jgi:predicted SAM-dependent methyltransferase
MHARLRSRARRPLTSYAKVQALAGLLLRNRSFQLRRPRIRDLQYLNIGCGRNIHSKMINLDYLWHSGVDVCWDITRGLPFAAGSMRGIFTEHCLEHFSLSTAVDILRECRRVLRPGGLLRIVVPDGELYLRTYNRQIDGDISAKFPFQDQESFDSIHSPILSVNRIFYQDRDSDHGHRFIYDFHFLAQLLHYCGFVSVTRQSFGVGREPAVVVDSESRAVESLYMEATTACC